MKPSHAYITIAMLLNILLFQPQNLHAEVHGHVHYGFAFETLRANHYGVGDSLHGWEVKDNLLYTYSSRFDASISFGEHWFQKFGFNLYSTNRFFPTGLFEDPNSSIDINDFAVFWGNHGYWPTINYSHKDYTGTAVALRSDAVYYKERFLQEDDEFPLSVVRDQVDVNWDFVPILAKVQNRNSILKEYAGKRIDALQSAIGAYYGNFSGTQLKQMLGPEGYEGNYHIAGESVECPGLFFMPLFVRTGTIMDVGFELLAYAEVMLAFWHSKFNTDNKIGFSAGLAKQVGYFRFDFNLGGWRRQLTFNEIRLAHTDFMVTGQFDLAIVF